MIKLRTPRDVYFNHGFIHFNQQDGKLMFQAWTYKKDGSGQFLFISKRPVGQDLVFLQGVTKLEHIAKRFDLKVTNK